MLMSGWTPGISRVPWAGGRFGRWRSAAKAISTEPGGTSGAHKQHCSNRACPRPEPRTSWQHCSTSCRPLPSVTQKSSNGSLCAQALFGLASSSGMLLVFRFLIGFLQATPVSPPSHAHPLIIPGSMRRIVAVALPMPETG